MRLIRNPFNEMEVKKILKYVVPCCEHVRDYAWYQNEQFNRVEEVPEWRSRIDRDSLMQLYKKENPLDRNNTKNLYSYHPNDLGLRSYVSKIKGVLEEKYKSKVTRRGTFYYPPTGYMGWHTNCDAPGERFYISWASEDKKSFFRYYDYENDEIITDYDSKGITVRQFNIPDRAPHLWHCVGSECDRLSIGFRVHCNVRLDLNTYIELEKRLEGREGRLSNLRTDYVTELINNAKHS